ncbi:glycosyltransferase [Paenibacillus sp. Y412MC10]|uniref:glycosyltransferase n=1 Tax=Geobacillus sp. (strain Y412MC10) TaxID=481743 RepID=UPI0011A59D38|nr:glycosyltransferase [Paenibacillus sp. Y412MC10]
MKLLHVTLGLPPYRTGGLTKYSVDLMLSQLQQGHEVSLLYPGRYTWSGKMKTKPNPPYEGIGVYEILNPLPVPLLGGIGRPPAFSRAGDPEVFLELLREVQPDLIHFHTLMGIHKELLEAAKALGIRTVYTSHDYFGICPKVNLLNAAGDHCDDFDQGKSCISCNQHAYSPHMIYMMQSYSYRRLKNSRILQKARRAVKKRTSSTSSTSSHMPRKAGDSKPMIYPERANEYKELRSFYLEMYQMIDEFHFNSQVAKEIFTAYLNVKGKVLSIRHRHMADRRVLKSFPSADKPLRIAYLGPVDRYKGFFLLQEALDQLPDTHSGHWHLHVYGNDGIPASAPPAEHCTFHGRYEPDELAGIFAETDLLIVPSIWKETFGFVGLEGLSYGVPVLVSRQAGVKDMIADGVNGWIFEPDPADLAHRLSHLLANRHLLAAANRSIVNSELDLSMQRHAQDIYEWYLQIGEEVVVK